MHESAFLFARPFTVSDQVKGRSDYARLFLARDDAPIGTRPYTITSESTRRVRLTYIHVMCVILRVSSFAQKNVEQIQKGWGWETNKELTKKQLLHPGKEDQEQQSCSYSACGTGSSYPQTLKYILFHTNSHLAVPNVLVMTTECQQHSLQLRNLNKQTNKQINKYCTSPFFFCISSHYTESTGSAATSVRGL